MTIQSINAKVREYKVRKREWERNQKWYGKSVSDLANEIQETFNILEPFNYCIHLPKNLTGVNRIDISRDKNVVLFTCSSSCNLHDNPRIEWLRYVYSHMDEILDIIYEDVDSRLSEGFEY